MKSNFVIALAASVAAVGLLPALSYAQTSAVTDPVGFTTVQCLSGSDTLVSIPFTRPAEFVGSLQSVSGATITPAGTLGWTANQFVYAAGTQSNHYYALVGPAGSTNPKEGRMYNIVSNTATALTLSLNGDDISTIPQGAQVSIIPYWTLATAFPAGNANASFTPTTSTRGFNTQILIPDYAAQGLDPSYSATYFFSNNVNGTSNNVGWRIFGDNVTNHGDDVLLQDGYVVVRNLGNAPTLPFVAMGNVVTKKLTVPLATLGNGLRQDNSVSITRPVDITLSSSGLNPTDGSFVATSLTRNFGDQVLVYDNSIVGYDKSPVGTYFYSNNVNGTSNNVGWRIFGDNITDRGNVILPAGSCFTIRKAPTSSGQTAFWTNAPTY